MTKDEIDQLSPVLRAQQVAQLLDISTDSVYEAVKRGDIPALRLGRLLRFSRDAIVTLINAGQ